MAITFVSGSGIWVGTGTSLGGALGNGSGGSGSLHLPDGILANDVLVFTTFGMQVGLLATGNGPGSWNQIVTDNNGVNVYWKRAQQALDHTNTVGFFHAAGVFVFRGCAVAGSPCEQVPVVNMAFAGGSTPPTAPGVTPAYATTQVLFLGTVFVQGGAMNAALGDPSSGPALTQRAPVWNNAVITGGGGYQMALGAWTGPGMSGTPTANETLVPIAPVGTVFKNQSAVLLTLIDATSPPLPPPYNTGTAYFKLP